MKGALSAAVSDETILTITDCWDKSAIGPTITTSWMSHVFEKAGIGILKQY